MIDPDQVEKDEKISWAVSYWYWKVKVRKNQNVINDHQFGASTKIVKKNEHSCNPLKNNNLFILRLSINNMNIFDTGLVQSISLFF